jgi:preprotein translocase subunit YajC
MIGPTTTLLAQEAPRGNVTFLFSLVLLVAIFYFLLIRPQQRRARQQRELLSSLEVGDEVVTIGGVFGRIRSMDDEAVILEAEPDGTRLRFVKQAIARKLQPEDLGEAGDTP